MTRFEKEKLEGWRTSAWPSHCPPIWRWGPSSVDAPVRLERMLRIANRASLSPGSKSTGSACHEGGSKLHVPTSSLLAPRDASGETLFVQLFLRDARATKSIPNKSEKHECVQSRFRKTTGNK